MSRPAIELTLNTDNIEDQLNDLLGHWYSSDEIEGKIIRQTLNKTARDALKIVAERTQEKYLVNAAALKNGKAKDEKTKATVRIKNATKKRLESAVVANGKKLELMKFKVSPNTPSPKNPPPAIYGQVLKSGSLKKIMKNGTKPFIATFKSGHTALVYRTGKKKPAKPIMRTVFSPSIPQLFGGEKVYGVLKPEIGTLLEKNLRHFVDKEIKRQIKEAASAQP